MIFTTTRRTALTAMAVSLGLGIAGGATMWHCASRPKQLNFSGNLPIYDQREVRLVEKDGTTSLIYRDRVIGYSVGADCYAEKIGGELLLNNDQIAGIRLHLKGSLGYADLLLNGDEIRFNRELEPLSGLKISENDRFYLPVFNEPVRTNANSQFLSLGGRYRILGFVERGK